MKAPRNTWYAAGWPSDFTAAPTQRTILEEPLVFFRTSVGKLVALHNICTHRFAPLHMGKVIGDTLECPYHGLRYNTSGVCVFNPDLDGQVSPRSRVNSYPVVEKGGVCWIWMGDPAEADEAKIVDFPFLHSPDTYRPLKGYLHVRANYHLLIDNLVDVAHGLILHAGTLSTPGLAKGHHEVGRDGDGIWVKRSADECVPSPVFDMLWRRVRGDYTGLLDHWTEARWDAPTLISQVTGSQVHGEPHETGLQTRNCHLVTPATEHSSHYFWAICRNFLLDDDRLDDEMRVGIDYAFIEQDEKMLEAVHRNLNGRDFWDMKPALLKGDSGTVLIRRAIDRLVAAENQSSAEPAKRIDTSQVPS